MRKVKCYTPYHNLSLVWVKKPHANAAIARIINVETVTSSGVVLEAVNLREVFDRVERSDVDLAVCVGYVFAKDLSPLANTYPTHAVLPELWYWRDKFWVKAHTAVDLVLEYYKVISGLKCSLFYEVTITDDDRSGIFEHVIII